MPPKTLSDWLESSSDENTSTTNIREDDDEEEEEYEEEEDASPDYIRDRNIPASAESPTVKKKKPAAAATSGAASEAEKKRQVEAEERRKRQEELKERMRAALGATAVETTTAAAAANANRRAHRRTDSEDSMFSNVNAPSRPPQVPSSARSSIDGSATKHHRRSSHDESANFGVMVMDQGCQTVCEIETQTDPDPLMIASPQWYYQYYGHTTAPLHGFVPFAPYSGVAAAGHMPMMNTPAAFVPGGPLGGPAGMSQYQQQMQMPSQQQQMMGNMAPQAVTDFRNQLKSVQAAVDGLITKYNLPPPPGLVS